MFEVINNTPNTSDLVAKEMTPLERFISSLKYWLIRQRRKFPYLVWYNDELDVTVTLSQDKLRPEVGIEQLWSGAFAEIERTLSAMGIGFDKGMGPSGRDWEWDWSLKGPISVRFRSRATRPEKRMERPKPKLVQS